MKKLLAFLIVLLWATSAMAQPSGGGGVNIAAPMTMFVNVQATAATTSIPYSCWYTPQPVVFTSWQMTVVSVAQTVPPSLSLCDTGVSPTPSACGTALANTNTFTAAGNLNTSVNASVAAGHYVCAFFNAGTLTAANVSGTATAIAAGVNPSFSRSWLSGSSNAVVSNSVANYWAAEGPVTAVTSTSEGDVSTIVPTAGTARNLKCTLTTAAGVVTVAGGTNYVLALRQNIATSALTCTIGTAASTCTDTTHTANIAVGDQLDFIDTPSGTPTALVTKCTVEIDS